jgi:phosphohistidine phosphatase
MKRTLVLIRHAKSDWNISAQPDFERTLNERGKLDAPVMGQRLLAKNVIPDLIISSSAHCKRIKLRQEQYSVLR